MYLSDSWLSIQEALGLVSSMYTFENTQRQSHPPTPLFHTLTLSQCEIFIEIIYVRSGIVLMAVIIMKY